MNSVDTIIERVYQFRYAYKKKKNTFIAKN